MNRLTVQYGGKLHIGIAFAVSMPPCHQEQCLSCSLQANQGDRRKHLPHQDILNPWHVSHT